MLVLEIKDSKEATVCLSLILTIQQKQALSDSSSGGEQSLKRGSASPNVCLDIPGGGRDLSPK